MSGLYVHIPYCHAKCAYCDFYSTPKGETSDKYIEALRREYDMRRNEPGADRPSTIYFGGGTPSILSTDLIERMLDFLPTDNAEEITIEVNPEDVTGEFARFLSDSRINRVSMGIQSLDNTELQSIGRRHTAEDAVRAVEHLRSAGIENLSLDLIYGLPGQTLQSWNKTLDKTLELHPEHLSAYSLMYEPGTRLWAQLQAGKIRESSQELSEQMYLSLCAKVNQHGMDHYEISNFALPGLHSRHNSSYWNLTPYLGLGVSAHSYDGAVRRFNPPQINRYINATEPIYDEEILSHEQRINEYLLIRLRTSAGIDISDFNKRFGNEALRRLLAKARQQPLLKLTDSSLSISEKNWLVTDTILVDLFE